MCTFSKPSVYQTAQCTTQRIVQIRQLFTAWTRDVKTKLHYTAFSKHN